MVDSGCLLDHLCLTGKLPRELVALLFSGVPLLQGPGPDESSDDQPLMKELEVLEGRARIGKHVIEQRSCCFLSFSFCDFSFLSWDQKD